MKTVLLWFFCSLSVLMPTARAEQCSSSSSDNACYMAQIGTYCSTSVGTLGLCARSSSNGSYVACSCTPVPGEGTSQPTLQQCCTRAGGFWMGQNCSRPFGACAGDCSHYEATKQQYNCEQACGTWTWTSDASGTCSN